jgi:transposase InsO family protein
MLLREQNIQASMSKKGDCYDNAMIESVRRCVLFLLVGWIQPHKNEGE